jgi:hypothetical protein
MPSLDIWAILKAVLKPELLQWATVYVVVLQVIKRGVPFIDTTQPLPKPLAWGLFASNYVFGFILAFVWAAYNPIVEGGVAPNIGNNPWLVGPVVGTYMQLLYSLAQWGFSEWQTKEVANK